MCLALTKANKVCKRKAVDDFGYCELHSEKYKINKIFKNEIYKSFPFCVENIQDDLAHYLLNVYLKYYDRIFKHLPFIINDFSMKILSDGGYIQSQFLINKIKEEIASLTFRIEKNMEKNMVKKCNKLLTLFHIGSLILNFQYGFFSQKESVKKKSIPNVSFEIQKELIDNEWNFWFEKYDSFVEKLVKYCIEKDNEMINTIVKINNRKNLINNVDIDDLFFDKDYSSSEDEE